MKDLLFCMSHHKIHGRWKKFEKRLLIENILKRVLLVHFKEGFLDRESVFTCTQISTLRWRSIKSSLGYYLLGNLIICTNSGNWIFDYNNDQKQPWIFDYNGTPKTRSCTINRKKINEEMKQPVHERRPFTWRALCVKKKVTLTPS